MGLDLARVRKTNINLKLISQKKIKLTASTKFNLRIAKRFAKVEYYKAQSWESRNYEFLSKERAALSTIKSTYVSHLIRIARSKGISGWKTGTGRELLGIYEKSKRRAALGKEVRFTNILKVVSKPSTLLLAYREIRGNKGALTPAAEKFYGKEVSSEMKFLAENQLIFPDGFSLKTLLITSKLLRTGKYFWGLSRRIYIDKPGDPSKKRPITIPPFMDRIVQKAIEMVLVAIYEPSFEKRNRSFGFRPNKGVHDAMAALSTGKASGMRTALEGDVEAAYDTVNKDKLLNILSKKIKDQKFLKLMKQRLQYSYLDTESNEVLKPPLGIPQGGIDSPYLFNIYLSELDEYVHTEVSGYLNRLNEKVQEKSGSDDGTGKAVRKHNPAYQKASDQIAAIRKTLKKQKDLLGTLPMDRDDPQVSELRKKIFSTINELRLSKHARRKVTSASRNRYKLRFFYVRYADDWILLTNGSVEVAEKIKRMISAFLLKELGLKLSDKKTLVTNVTEKPAKFLGFEVTYQDRGQERKDNPRNELSRVSGLPARLSPDRQRLLDRMHMKGFCDKNGFPRELSWLSTMEAPIIVERYNAVMRGLFNFYAGVIKAPSDMYRWYYILKFSCLKTLAKKYKSNISKIVKENLKVVENEKRKKMNDTVKFVVRQKVNRYILKKEYYLLTYYELLDQAISLGTLGKGKITFYERERGIIGEYPSKSGRITKVTNKDYLDEISWTSIRTQASFDMPCASCGSTEAIHMHHIKHVRKSSYQLIPEKEAFKKILSLRNRKQVPLCAKCHLSVVHAGKYSGESLSTVAPKIKIPTGRSDNRVIDIESFIHKGISEVDYRKDLLDKGWIIDSEAMLSEGGSENSNEKRNYAKKSKDVKTGAKKPWEL